MSALVPTLELDVAGLRIRFVQLCDCEEPEGLVGVAAEPAGDRWFFFAVVDTEMLTDDYDLKAELEAEFADHTTHGATLRGIAAFGVPWEELDTDVMVAQDEALHGPDWWNEEIAWQTPEQLRALRRYVVGGPEHFAWILKAIRMYRRSR